MKLTLNMKKAISYWKDNNKLDWTKRNHNRLEDQIRGHDADGSSTLIGHPAVRDFFLHHVSHIAHAVSSLLLRRWR